MNDYSNIPAESEFRDAMTQSLNELGQDIADLAPELSEDGPGDLDENDEMVDDDDPNECEPDESMDGDFDSGMASAGLGTDESYGYYGDGEW